MSSSSLSGVSRYHLLRFNGQQDLLFVRLDMDKQQNIAEAALQAAPGGVWVGEYAASDDDETVQALVFVNAMTSGGIKREDVISTLHRAVSRLTRRLEAQDAETSGD